MRRVFSVSGCIPSDFPLSVWIDDAFVISLWYFLAHSRNSGQAWQGGELEFFKSPSREIILRHIFSFILPILKIPWRWLASAHLSIRLCELPLIIDCLSSSLEWFASPLQALIHPSGRISFANFYLHDIYTSKWEQLCLFTVAAGVHNVGPECIL